MTTKKRILVTGASGYIAGKLIPRLLENGYSVRCMVRDEAKLAGRPWRGQVDVVCADVADRESLPPALEGVHSAYYLIHNMSSGHGYQQIELEGAQNFAQAAHHAGVQHIIYLGGLADPEDQIAPHMRSRIETGNTLRQHDVPVTEFRAGVIIGPGSISFEMIRYLSEHFPVLIGPTWLKNKSQPISAENMIDYLIAALDTPQGQGEVFEIGGEDVMTYAEVMTGYCRGRKLFRPLLVVPYIPTSLMAYFVDRLTPVQKTIAYPLIEGLKSSSVVSDPHALEIFPQIVPQSFAESVAQSLNKLHPSAISRSWRASALTTACIKSEGFLISSREMQSNTTPNQIFTRLKSWAQGHNPRWQIDISVEDQNLLIEDTHCKRGRCWIEWEILPVAGSQTLLRQTSYFAPRGLLGFLSQWGWLAEMKEILKQISLKISEAG